MEGFAQASTEPGSVEPDVSVRASLDVPGETRRQATVFAIWFIWMH